MAEHLTIQHFSPNVLNPHSEVSNSVRQVNLIKQNTYRVNAILWLCYPKCLESVRSVLRGVQYTTFPVSVCASAVSRALLSWASVLERALVSLPTQIHSVQSQLFTKDLHFLLWRHGMQLTAAFIDLLKGHSYSTCFLSHVITYTFFTVHSYTRQTNWDPLLQANESWHFLINTQLLYSLFIFLLLINTKMQGSSNDLRFSSS